MGGVESRSTALSPPPEKYPHLYTYVHNYILKHEFFFLLVIPCTKSLLVVTGYFILSLVLIPDIYNSYT